MGGRRPPLNARRHAAQIRGGIRANGELFARKQLLTFDRRLQGALADGTIRLLSVAYLRKCRSPIQRRQELAEGLISEQAAVALLRRGDRSIFAMSYGWLTREHPDPDGKRLQVLREAFKELEEQKKLPPDAALFWDFASLPQKDANGERSEPEKAQFKRGLAVMASMYASPLGTSVIYVVLPCVGPCCRDPHTRTCTPTS
jgi:hypothetical protein